MFLKRRKQLRKIYKSKWQKTAVNKNWKYYILINISNLHEAEYIIGKVIKYKNNISKINTQFCVINSYLNMNIFETIEVEFAEMYRT